jgi:hypothetical protein
VKFALKMPKPESSMDNQSINPAGNTKKPTIAMNQKLTIALHCKRQDANSSTKFVPQPIFSMVNVIIIKTPIAAAAYLPLQITSQTPILLSLLAPITSPMIILIIVNAKAEILYQAAQL